MNGKYTFVIVPVHGNDTGTASAESAVEVKNSWVAAPSLACELVNGNQIKLKWTSPQEIERYHIAVSAGSGSVLRFVNLDYKPYKEFDVDAKPGVMEYTFQYDQKIDPENGTKLKIEIYGLRHATSGAEQKSSASAQTILLK